MQLHLNEFVNNRENRPKLLVVDDQAINIRIIHDLFKEDYDVVMATNGEQAILQCESQNPDLILLDVLMPGMDGHEVCRRLKARSETRAIPIIFLTAQYDEAEEALGFDLGAVDFITKPINNTIVRARVRTHLALKLQVDVLKSIALIDGLTGVANRRRYDEDLQINWLRCARNGQFMSLMMIDVDHFKRYNDYYGHQQGDTCLRQVAQAIKSVLKRPYDLVARYGGEEFACLLPDIRAAGAVPLAEQILNTVRGLSIEHVMSDSEKIVTVSIGVATRIADNGTPASVLSLAADQQLYESKRLGRARVSSVELRAD